MVQYHDDLGPLMVPIDSVTQHPQNYNNGDVEAIVESISVNGMYRPIIVDRDSNEIIAGNHTWMACKELGAEIIPVIRYDGDSPAHVVRGMIADNWTASLARPDNAQLVALLDDLAQTEHGLTGSGVTEQDLHVLRALAEMPVDAESLDFAQWPSLCFQVPPHVKTAFMEMTDAAGGDRERFELLLRLAGWDGH